MTVSKRATVGGATVCALLAISGCAAIEPRSVAVEAQHVSHVSQHFGAHPTDFGYDAVMLRARWRDGRWFADVADGAVIESQDPRVSDKCHGGLFGPREVFQADVGFDVWRRK